VLGLAAADTEGHCHAFVAGGTGCYYANDPERTATLACTAPPPHASRPEAIGSCGHTRVMLARYCPSSRSCGISSWIRIFWEQSHRRRKRLRTRKCDPTFSTRGSDPSRHGLSAFTTAERWTAPCTFFGVQLCSFWDTFPSEVRTRIGVATTNPLGSNQAFKVVPVERLGRCIAIYEAPRTWRSSRLNGGLD
jgi:hypothetical protein